MHRTAGTRLFWQVAYFAVPLAALYAFLQDIIAPDWPAWVLSPALVFGFYGLVSKFDDGSFVRAIMWQLALAAFVFASVYNLFDIVIGPDWPLWVISPLIVLGAWAGMLVLSANIYDE